MLLSYFGFAQMYELCGNYATKKNKEKAIYIKVLTEI